LPHVLIKGLPGNVLDRDEHASIVTIDIEYASDPRMAKVRQHLSFALNEHLKALVDVAPKELQNYQGSDWMDRQQHISVSVLLKLGQHKVPTN